MPPAYRLMALDVDGTLIGSSGTPSPRVLKALKAAHQLRVRIALCTGRPYSSVKHLLRLLTIATPPIVFNGALVPALTGLAPLVEKPLNSDVARNLARVALKTGDFFEIHTADECFVLRDGPERAYQMAKLGIEQHIRPIAEIPWHQAILKCQFVVATPHQRARLEGLAEHLTEQAHFSWGVSPGFEGWFVNIMQPGIDKRSSLDTLLTRLDIPWTQVLAAGDSPSDLDYVNQAGYGVIMGNAPAEVRQAARRVAGSVDQDGLADVIEDVLL